MKESRLSEMADYIGKHKSVSLKHLANKFDISIYTVRRDIDELEKRGIATKQYGGVFINKSDTYLVDFDDRHTVYKKEKQNIAQRAVSFIQPGDVIFIDGGTTTLYIPDYLQDINITVVTNNIFIITKLLSKKNIDLIILGGVVDRSTNSVKGIDTIEFLRNMNISKCFLSCTGVSDNFNLTNHTSVEAELKKLCLSISHQSYLLADQSKFGVSSLINYGNISQLDAVITNEGIPNSLIQFCKEKEVPLYLE